MAGNTASKQDLFETMPVPKALATLALPTIISQLINLIYNLADAFYVGRTGNSYMIAAVSVSFTLFILTIPLSNLYGVGTGSHIARLLGVKEGDRAKAASSFAFYSALAFAVVYGIVLLIFLEPILILLGASSETLVYCKQYTLFTTIIGGPFIVLSTVMAHFLRNVGFSKQASMGLSGGGILNIILDPLFMFVIFPEGYEVLGAAVATMLSNLMAALFFIFLHSKIKDQTGLSIDPKDIRDIRKEDISEIYKVGVPSACLSLFFDVGNMFLTAKMANHGDLQLSGLGICMKVERLSNSIGIGISQSMIPLIAYNFSSGNYKRMNDTIRFGRMIGIAISLVCIAMYEICATPMINFFVNTEGENAQIALQTVAYGVLYLRIRALVSPFQFLNYHSSYSLQAIGEGKLTWIHAFIRQVLFNISFIFIFDLFLLPDFLQAGVPEKITGLVLAMPIAEFLGAWVAIGFLAYKLKQVFSKSKIGLAE